MSETLKKIHKACGSWLPTSSDPLSGCSASERTEQTNHVSIHSLHLLMFSKSSEIVQYKHEGAGNGINKNHKYVRQEIDRLIKSIKYHSLPCNCEVHKCHIQEVYKLCTFLRENLCTDKTHIGRILWSHVPVHHECINVLGSSCVLHAKMQGNEPWMSNRVKTLHGGVRVSLNFATSTSLTRSAVYWGAWSYVLPTLYGEKKWTLLWVPECLITDWLFLSHKP